MPMAMRAAPCGEEELGVPMVDEHYYVDPGWMIHNQDY
ncbi:MULTISPECIES: hypothetical protein [Bacteroides]